MNVHKSETDEFITHHGIKGMKWGVRRTPQQLGHDTVKKASKVKRVKTPGKAFRKSTSISDEELQRRINRLNMEERYEDLVARQNARLNKGFIATSKKLLANSAEDLGRQLLSKAVSKLVDRIAGDKKFDIDDYMDMDVSKMDDKTIAKVSTWYENAGKIKKGRKSFASDSSSNSESATARYKPQSTSSSGTSNIDYSKRPAFGSTPSSRISNKRKNAWIRNRNAAIRSILR